MRLLKIAFLAGFAAAAAFAQATAQIHGTVQDTSGAVIADAMVKATQTETGINAAYQPLLQDQLAKLTGWEERERQQRIEMANPFLAEPQFEREPLVLDALIIVIH